MYEADNVKYKGLEISVYYDEDPQSPGDWYMLGTFYHWHRSYRFANTDVSIRDWESEDLKEKFKDAIYLPLYMYDHSGITINTTGFSCPWDSGQFGYYVVEKAKIRKEYGVQRVSAKLEQKVKNIMQDEIKTWDDYLRGEVYGYMVKDPNDDDVLDSCWGYYGDEGREDAISEAKSFINYRTSLEYTSDHKQQSIFKETA